MKFFRHLSSGLRALRLKDFSLARADCPFCGPTVFVKLNSHESGIRCVRCTASIVHLSMGSAIKDTFPLLSELTVCELSSRGPLVDYLRRNAKRACFSEYRDDVEPGQTANGVRCEDVQRLTYPNDSFDLITHSEVMEHVPDDRKSFHELRRVLRGNGVMIFTVPLSGNQKTTKRAEVLGGVVNHLLEPVYHTDPWRAGQGILAFRDYGMDIVDELYRAGFHEVRIVTPGVGVPWISLRPVIIATTAASVSRFD